MSTTHAITRLRKPLGVLTSSEKGPSGSFDLYEDERLPRYTCDGATQIAVGPFFSKILFHSVDTVDGSQTPPHEFRRAVLELTIPTNSLMMLAGFVFQSVAANRDGLIMGLDHFKKALSDMQFDEPPAST